MAGASRDNFPLIDEIRRYRHSLIEQTAWIIAQIQDKATQLAAVLLLDSFHGGFQAGFGLLGDLRQPDLADIVRLHTRLHHLNMDGLAY